MRYKPHKNSELLEEMSLIGQLAKEQKISKQSCSSWTKTQGIKNQTTEVSSYKLSTVGAAEIRSSPVKLPR